MIQLLVAIVLSAGAAKAEGYYRVTVNGKSCSELLTGTAAPAQAYTPLDYQISDLEGLFFTYLAKLRDLKEVSPSRLQYFMKDMLSMKAEILNDVGSLLPVVAGGPLSETRKDELLVSLFQIVDTMGIPGTVYGFQVDDQGNLSHPSRKKAKKFASKQKVTIASKEAIGFLGGLAPDRDLPDGLHRSIGFGPQTVSEEKAPLRKGGSIQRSIAPDNKESILIVDGETGEIYPLPIARVAFQGMQLDGKVYRLDFNEDEMEWIVAVENLNNPSGRIGF